MRIITDDKFKTTSFLEDLEFFIGSLRYPYKDYISMYKGDIVGDGFKEISRFNIKRVWK